MHKRFLIFALLSAMFLTACDLGSISTELGSSDAAVEDDALVASSTRAAGPGRGKGHAHGRDTTQETVEDDGAVPESPTTDEGAGGATTDEGAAGAAPEEGGAATASDPNASPGAYPSCDGSRVASGADLQREIDAHARGATLCLESGVYRLRDVLRPKNDQVIMAVDRRGAVLTGGGSTDMAFNGDGVTGVTVRGLVVEDFATPDVPGLSAVKTGHGWKILDNEIRNNDKSGIYHGSNVMVRGNYIHHNKVLGIGGYRSVGAMIIGNEVAYNSVGDTEKDSGGAKWVGTRDLTVRDNHFHHNGGTGIWLDTDNINAVIEGNRSNYNTGAAGGKGFQYEISCAGVVRNNVAVGNAHAGLELVASRDVEVYGNRFAGNAYGVRVWHQDRGNGRNCDWSLGNVRIHSNDIAMDRGYTGVQTHNVRDGDSIFDRSDDRVRFWDNRYDLGVERGFHWRDELRTLDEWNSFGLD